MKRKKDLFPNGFEVDLTPFREFMNRMDTVFNDSFKHMNTMFDFKPFWINVEETDAAFIITADLEKVAQENIHIDVIENKLIISVETTMKHEAYNEAETLFEQKTNAQQMTRVVRLPFLIPRSQTKARYSEGQLVITIPKPDSERIIIEEEL